MIDIGQGYAVTKIESRNHPSYVEPHSGGMLVRLDEVPLRDATLGPPEILMSESQERMARRATGWRASMSGWGWTILSRQVLPTLTLGKD